MMREIKESDWKFLRQLHKVALERFCEQILLEIQSINSDSAKSFHQRYLDIFKVFHRRDKEVARTFNGLRRSTAWIQLAPMKARGLVTEDDFLCFSQETGMPSICCLAMARKSEKIATIQRSPDVPNTNQRQGVLHRNARD